MTELPPRRVLFRCDGAPIPARLGEQRWFDRRHIRSRGDRADLTLKIEERGGTVLTAIRSRSTDLVRIASYVYRADTLVPRAATNDASDERWRRHFALCIPVADLAYWEDPDVQGRLNSALNFGTGDTWEFAFAQATAEFWPLPFSIDPAELYDRPTAVSLFSGGADSLCVLLEAIAKGERPVAVGHWSTDTHEHRQTGLLTDLRRRYPGLAIPHFGFTVQGINQEGPEHTRRTRGFLFASLGAAVASEIGVERVLYGDNGPISINLPLNGQVVGAHASRSTHPKFLERFNHLIAGMFDHPIAVENPLLMRTRPEVLEVLTRTHAQDLLSSTLSCSTWRGRPIATPHCGVCTQCVDRRFATIAAGLEAVDPASRYQHDVFLEDLLDWEARMIAVSYVRFAQEINRLSDDDLLLHYGQLFDALTEDDPQAERTLRRLVELLKRHARSVLDVLATMTKRHLTELVEGRLPATCLLRIAVAGAVVPETGVSISKNLIETLQPEPPVASIPPLKAAPRENEFVFDADHWRWRLTYKDETRTVKSSVNLTRLACLLAEPFRAFSPEELLATAHPNPPGMMDVPQAISEGLGLEHYGAGGFLFDEDSGEFIEKGISGLRAAADAAREKGKDARAAEFEEEIARTKAEWEKGLKLDGTPRPHPDNVTRRPDSMRRSIERAILDIADRLPVLAEHLNDSVSIKDARYAYQPKNGATWRVVRPSS